jgi:hypothetical protein
MPRILLVLIVCFVGVAVDVALVMKFHAYRAPALVFIAMMAAGYWILRKKAPSAGEQKWIARRGQGKTARSMRRFAYLYIFVLTVFFASGQYKVLPLWQVLPMLIIPISVFIVYPLWIAKRIERLSPDEWKKRIGQ